LSEELSRKLTALSRKEGTTLFMTLMAAFKVLLSRYSGQEQFIVSTGIANRTRPETESLIGCLINILLLKADLSGNPSFREFLGREREIAIGAYAHPDLPFERLVEKLQPKRDLSYNPLTQVMFVLLKEAMDHLELDGLKVDPVDVESVTAQYDLVMHIWETPDGLAGFWHYSTDLFDPSTIARMLSHFQGLLEGIVAEPGKRILDLPLLTEAERRMMLRDWNDTRNDFPREKCLHELFELQVEKAPDATAIIFGEDRLSYRQLNFRANQLGNYLRSLGVGPDLLVGICVERSIEMVVGILGIMKAGGAYVPLDPAYPAGRLKYMLEDSAPAVLLTQGHLEGLFPGVRDHLPMIDLVAEAPPWGEQPHPRSATGPARRPGARPPRALRPFPP
jgi:non-ribosomal peptide synthetase component F